jgi:hypothetical protein
MNGEPQPHDIPLTLYCDYSCESCPERSTCIVYAFERLGKKLGSPESDDGEHYRDLLTNIQENLSRTIDLVRDASAGVVGKGDAPDGDGTTPENPQRVEVLRLSREFTIRTYELLRAIRREERIPLKLLLSLRDLQWHHTLVTTKLCRAFAVLADGRGGGREESGASAHEAEVSLDKCRGALQEIAKTLPSRSDLVGELLSLSDRIWGAIKLRFS